MARVCRQLEERLSTQRQSVLTRTFNYTPFKEFAFLAALPEL
jgi:hypothetical protein